MSRVFRTPFGSALVGGAVVAAFGGVAIAAGWIAAEGGATTSVQTSTGAPGAVKDSEDSGPTPFGKPEPEGGPATGSGFLIDTEGHIVTNSHVVEGADRVSVTLGASDESHPAEIVGTDPATDVALLKVDVTADELHPLALGDSSRVQVGDPVVAIRS